MPIGAIHHCDCNLYRASKQASARTYPLAARAHLGALAFTFARARALVALFAFETGFRSERWTLFGPASERASDSTLG